MTATSVVPVPQADVVTVAARSPAPGVLLRSYRLSDQRIFEVPCPECGAMQMAQMFGVVVTSTMEQRIAWIEEAKKLCRCVFGQKAHSHAPEETARFDARLRDSCVFRFPPSRHPDP